MRRRAALRILGLDPGSVHTGWGVVSKEGSSLRSLAAGRISPPRRKPMAERLGHLSRGLEEVVEEWQPDMVVLESLFHGANTRSLIILAQARGALLAVLARGGLEVQEYSPAEVKSALTGNGRAGKEQVARMVGMLLDLDRAGLSADATDALAVAICGAQRRRLDHLAAGGRKG